MSQSEARLKALERALDGLGSSLTPANEVGATTADKDEEGVEDRLRIEWNAEGLSQEVRRGVTLDLVGSSLVTSALRHCSSGVD